MILVEETVLAAEALPLAAFRAHLRLGSGFADDAAQDAVLEPCLRAALAAIEARTGKAVLARRFLWKLDAWRNLGRQALPVAPVTSLVSLVIRDRFEVAETVDPSLYRLLPDAHRPVLVARGFMLPQIPVAGQAEITFEAGYAAAWDGVPGDLRQAVLMLAAQYYDRRGDDRAEGAALPAAVEAVLAPYRPVRLFGGRG